MKRLLVTLAFVISSCNFKTDEINWGKVEIKISNEAKRDSLSKIDDAIIQGYCRQSFEVGSLGVFDLFHFLDVNKDMKEDIIFNGYGGAADEYVMIFLRTENGYAKVLEEFGQIKNITLSPETKIDIFRKALMGETSGDSTLTYRITPDTALKVLSKRTN